MGFSCRYLTECSCHISGHGQGPWETWSLPWSVLWVHEMLQGPRGESRKAFRREKGLAENRRKSGSAPGPLVVIEGTVPALRVRHRSPEFI